MITPSPTSIHESGHCAGVLAVGAELVLVEAFRKPAPWGRTYYRCRYPFGVAVIAMTGLAAADRGRGSLGDAEIATAALAKLPDPWAALDAAAAIANRIAMDLRGQIRELARELDRRGRVDARLAEAILRS
jgi:hypothetical protein